MEVGGVNLWYMVHHLHLLAKVLADYIAAPLGGVVLDAPLGDAPFQHGHVGVTHPLQGGGGQIGPAPIVITQDYLGIFDRNRGRHAELQVPAGDQAGVGDVGAVVLTRLSNIDQGKGGAAFLQGS